MDSQMGNAGLFRVLLTVLSVLLLPAGQSWAIDMEHRLGQGVGMAFGIGLEISHGDYGVAADATQITLPVTLLAYPREDVDLSLEVPLVYLRSRSDSGVVATATGGSGRRMGAAVEAVDSGVGESSSMTDDAGVGDISVSAGWTLVEDGEWTPKVRPTIYLKVPSGDEEAGLGTGTYEAGPGLALSKWMGQWQVFADGSYILQDSTDDYPGDNYLDYTAGIGLQATDRLFVSLYTQGSSAVVDGGDAPREGLVKVNFLQSRRLSWEAYVSTGFTDASPDTGGGLMMMYQF